MAAANSMWVLVVLLVAGCLAAEPKIVNVSTRYISTDETTLHQKESKTFIATLCQRFQNQSVNATVLLNNNPSWAPTFGVVDYYITDSTSKTGKNSLCNNTDSTGKRQANCFIKQWNNTVDNLYLIVSAGEVDSIVFSIDIEFLPPPIVTKSKKRFAKPSKWKKTQSGKKAPYNDDTEILTEIVRVGTSQNLQYHQTALLEVNFCKNSETTDNYEISSSVFGTYGRSSYAQYLCDDTPCEVDGKNVIKFEGKQLPNNNVYLTTTSGQYQHFYVLVVGWGGEYSPADKAYVGKFQYNAEIRQLH